jgi:ribose transport system permease protein
LSFSEIGALYTWLVVIVVFSLWVPDVFPTVRTIQAIANNYAIAALAGLAILMPVAAGVFDASVGGSISLAGVVCAWLLINTGYPIAVVVLLSLLVGAAIGLFNAFSVVVLRIPAFIATLATWLIADSLSVAVSGNQVISGSRVSGDFAKIAQGQVHGFTLIVIYVLVLMAVLGVFLTQTGAGRFVYAVGFDPEVARLAGVRVKSLQTTALIVSGIIGAFAGVVLTSQVASATPGGGDSYLLPAFAAVFLGATQFRAKRFNAIGTVIATYLLGTGEYGLLLAGAPQWTPNVFQGLALIVAIGLTELSGTRSPTRRRRWRLTRSGPTNNTPDTPPPTDIRTDPTMPGSAVVTDPIVS